MTKKLLSIFCALMGMIPAFGAAKFSTAKAVSVEAEGIAVTASGRIWLSLSGFEEGGPVCTALKSSEDGSKWKDAPLLIEGASRSVLWYSPDGALRLFYSRNGSIFTQTCADPESAGYKWGKAEEVGKGYPSAAPVQSGSTVVLPVMVPGEGPGVCISTDGGSGWEFRKGPAGIPELRKASDNNPGVYFSASGSLVMVVRSPGTAWSYVSESSDLGLTWSVPREFCFNPDKDFTVLGLREFGSTLLVKSARYDNKVYQLARGIYAYLTGDGGVTWYGGLQVDAREGTEGPKAVENGGRIFIAYTYRADGTNEIVLAQTSVPAIAGAWGTTDTPPASSSVVCTAGKAKEAFDKAAAKLYTVRRNFKDEPLRVATYNIEYHGFVKKPTWKQRIPVIKRIVEDERIELMGSQEPDSLQTLDLQRSFLHQGSCRQS